LAALACAVRTLEGDESTSDPRLLHGAKSTPGQPSGGQPSAPCWVVLSFRNVAHGIPAVTTHAMRTS
jgi:hypothetical protein